jgi:hypothetical protein
MREASVTWFQSPACLFANRIHVMTREAAALEYRLPTELDNIHPSIHPSLPLHFCITMLAPAKMAHG